MIYIQRQDTIMRVAISPGERLAVTLRYLATGESTKLVSPCRKRLVYAYRCHQDVLLVQMCRLERLHCQQSPPFCLLPWKNADVDWSRHLFRLSHGAFWYNVALKVDGEGVTRTNSDNIRATMLQQFKSTSNCCNMLPQQNFVLKIVRRAMIIVVKNRPV